MVETLATLSGSVSKIIRNLPWPIIGRIHRLPPVPAVETPGSLKVIVLTTRRRWKEAICTAFSWMVAAPLTFRLSIFFDDGPPEDAIRVINRLFPGAHSEAVRLEEEVEAQFGDKGLQFYRKNVFGRKLMLAWAKSLQETLIFSDPDVVVFRRPQELLDGVQSGKNMHLYDTRGWIDLEPNIVGLAHEMKLSVSAGFNSGVMLIQKNSWRSEALAECLRRYDPVSNHHFCEQTTVALLSAIVGSVPLPSKRYYTSDEDSLLWKRRVDTSQLVLRHYVGTVRHWLYLDGYPKLLKGYHQLQ